MSFSRGDSDQQKLDMETFDVMWDLSQSGGLEESCFLRVTKRFLTANGTDDDCALGLTQMPDFRVLEKKELPGDATNGVSFTTLTIDTPIYLHYLHARFLASGGSIVRAKVQHINQILEGGAEVFDISKPLRSVDAVIVCSGLGTRFLGGIEDKDVFPIRGQTVLLRAPWIRHSLAFDVVGPDPSLCRYFIPRRSGNVIIGGTMGVDDWFPRARPETTQYILKEALILCPELAGTDLPPGHIPSVEDLYPNIIEEGCGLRPGRKGGIRFGFDLFPVNDARKTVPVVYNYGHGGYGFQSSWGCASVVLRNLTQVFHHA
ncbi:hypothetical protein HGRIS_008957 [Hohenbuehelia grisea]